MSKLILDLSEHRATSGWFFCVQKESETMKQEDNAGLGADGKGEDDE